MGKSIQGAIFISKESMLLANKAKSITECFGIDFSQSRFINAEDSGSWFYPQYGIDKLLSSFWGIKTRSRLIAVSKNVNDEEWRGLVSEWDSYTASPGQFRLSKKLIFNLLRYSLGFRKEDFDLAKLSELEMRIFESFFLELEKQWKNQWRISDPNSSGANDFLIWVIEFENGDTANFAISVPPGLRPKEYLDSADYQVDLNHLINELDFRVPMDIVVGKTKLSLSDLKNLEEDDIIFLERSSIDKMWWERNDFENLYINIDLPSRDDEEWVDLYYDDIEVPSMQNNNSLSDDTDLLTDLNIELTAQFKSVNLPLKKIMELKDGGVIPLGLLLDSELILIAAGNKIVAKGELIVLGNQFGLKIKNTRIKSDRIGNSSISEGFTQSSPKHSAISSSQAARPAPQQARQAPQAAKEERFAEIDEEALLQKELEEVGLDPDELDELGELY
jgi:flagellar motor switch/type III secretory pathway protein FliN